MPRRRPQRDHVWASSSRPRRGRARRDRGPPRNGDPVFRIGNAEVHVNAPTGPVEAHLRRHGAGYCHLALADLGATIAELAMRDFALLGAPVETAPELREGFIDPATAGGVLILLVERKLVVSERHEVDAAAVARLANQGHTAEG